MMQAYPPYYEDAAHIVLVLTKSGLTLKRRSTHLTLMWLSCELELLALKNPSHSEEGHWLVRCLSGEPIDEVRRRRLDAIAGTLVGNFLLKCRPKADAHK